MPELYFSVYCGLCGAYVNDVTVADNRVTVTCRKCQAKIERLKTLHGKQWGQIEILKWKIKEMEKNMEKLKR